ncbi:hypothetical protein A6B37_12815 [Achromobacter sp. HZ01]|nr:hypothetical protein A6B37_12815 [Achromobacter sp. HZ01]
MVLFNPSWLLRATLEFCFPYLIDEGDDTLLAAMIHLQLWFSPVFWHLAWQIRMPVHVNTLPMIT